MEILKFESRPITDLINLLPGKKFQKFENLSKVSRFQYNFRIESCEISHGELDIYAMHSFHNNELCVDNSRLNVVQTEFGQNIGFSMRTFRFLVQGSQATEAQLQRISCNLHLEPVADVPTIQPADCSCHTATDCNQDNR